MLKKDLIKKYGFALRTGSVSPVIDLSDKLGIDFNFQIHKINDLVSEFDGNMPPNKFHHNVLALITKGSGCKQIGPVKFNISDNMIFFIAGNTIHSSIDWALDTDGYMLTFSDSFFSESKIPLSSSVLNSIFKYSFFPFHLISNELAMDIFNIFISIEEEEKNTDKLFNKEVLAIKVADLFFRYLRVFEAKPKEKNNLLYDNFLALLEDNYKKDKSVRYYSQLLNTHPNHLNRIVKKYSGESVRSVIKNRIIIEAKYYLCSTDFSIKQISRELGFTDQNSFSRYFKQSENLSMKDYRSKYV